MISRSRIFLGFCILISSCKTPQKQVIETFVKGPQILQGTPDRSAHSYIRFEKHCTTNLALKDIGTAPIWVEGENGIEKVDFDFSGVSGNGLVNEDLVGVFQDYIWEGQYKDCQTIHSNNTAFYCESLENENVNIGKFVLICNIPKDGYPVKSIENAALVSAAAYIKTVRNYSYVSEKRASTKIGILLLPEFRRVLHMANGKGVQVITDLDNARWSNRKVGKTIDFTIELLPTSTWRISKEPHLKEFWQKLGVVSHEVGHHFFANRIPKVKFSESKIAVSNGESDDPSYVSYYNPTQMDREFGLQNVISALDEGYADMVSHLTFSSSVNPYYGFVLDASVEARKVAASQVYRNGNPNLPEEKALTESVLRHFASSKRSAPVVNSYVPDHQDEHAIGAIVANSLDLLFGSKVGDRRDDPKTEEKYKLVLAWLDRVQDIFLKKKESYETVPAGGYSDRKGSATNYSTGPASFLRDAIWEAVKLAFIDANTLSMEQCQILERKFPVYVVNWKAQYQCR